MQYGHKSFHKPFRRKPIRRTPFGRTLTRTAPGAAFAVVLAAALGGCAAMPPPAQLAQPRSAGGMAAPAAFAGAAAFPDDGWWHAYGDPGLDALIAEALDRSPDMAIAAARIRSADALARQAGSANLPTLGVEGTAGGTKQSYNLGIPEQFVTHGVVDTGRLTATLGLDLDLWGRNRAALAAARGEAEAARVDAAQARLLLASGIALAWGDLAQLQASRAVAAAQADVFAQTAQLTAARQRAGIDGASEVDLATARSASAQQALAALDEAIALGRNRVAALIGAGPARAAQLPQPALNLTVATPLPLDLQANLVGRRPDLVAARLRAEAAAQRVKVARREFYPNINLGAVGGLQALGLSQLFDSGSTYASFGPAISLPIFQGGRLRGRYDGAASAYQEAVARYDQTLLGALREVADTIASRRALATRLASARSADAAATAAARLAALRYGQGIASQLQVLAAEDTALSAHRLVVELEVRAYVLDVMLAKALGGGFHDKTQPMGNS